MKIADSVKSAFDDGLSGKFDAALLHACIAIDATSKLLYPNQKAVGKRFTQCIRDYYWLIEPMLGAGINLKETVFSNVHLQKTETPDFADIVYEVFRCGHVHGDEIPEGFRILPSVGNWRSEWIFGPNQLQFPDRMLWALLSVSIFSRVNERQRSQHIGFYTLSLGDVSFPVHEWWGREDEVQPVALEHNQVRVKFEMLEQMVEAEEKNDDATFRIAIIQPNVPAHIRASLEAELAQYEMDQTSGPGQPV